MTIVAGDTVAALVAADALAERGEPVTLYLPERGIGGGFEPMRLGPWDLQFGLRLLETSYGPEEAPDEPPISAYVPGMSGHRPHIAHVRAFYRSLLGDDLVEAGRPEMFVNGRRAPDIYLTVDLTRLRGALTDEQARLIAKEADSGRTLADLWGRSLAAASLSQHGPTFHELLIEPFCLKVYRWGSEGVLATMRRKLWMPLFHSETVWEAASNNAVTYRPRRPFHTVKGDGVVKRLLDRLQSRAEVIRTPPLVMLDRGFLRFEEARQRRLEVRLPEGSVIGFGPETLFTAAGTPMRLERVPLTVCWVSVAERDILSLPSTVMVPDPSVTAFRVNDGGAHEDERLISIEGARLAHAQADLERLGIVRERACLGPVHEMHAPGFAAPTAGNRCRFAAARTEAMPILEDVTVIGGAMAFGADSLNEQVAQGLWAAEQV